MDEMAPKSKCCCITGHRPDKLHLSEREVHDALKKEIDRAVQDGFSTFFTGMAKGTDIIAAEIILEIRNHLSDIRLVCALPYPGFGKRWDLMWRERFSAILAQADVVETISPQSSRSCYQKRNEWMIDHAERVIAVFCGIKGGTLNTIQYAKRNGLEIYTVLNR